MIYCKFLSSVPGVKELANRSSSCHQFVYVETGLIRSCTLLGSFIKWTCWFRELNLFLIPGTNTMILIFFSWKSVNKQEKYEKNHIIPWCSVFFSPLWMNYKMRTKHMKYNIECLKVYSSGSFILDNWQEIYVYYWSYTYYAHFYAATHIVLYAHKKSYIHLHVFQQIPNQLLIICASIHSK